jgi:hypothetical protein
MLSASLRNQINPQPFKYQTLNKKFIEPGRYPLAWSLTSWFTYVSPIQKQRSFIIIGFGIIILSNVIIPVILKQKAPRLAPRGRCNETRSGIPGLPTRVRDFRWGNVRNAALAPLVVVPVHNDDPGLVSESQA